MQDYLTFVWQSFIHPISFLDLLVVIHFLLFLLFIYYIIRITILIFKLKDK